MVHAHSGMPGMQHAYSGTHQLGVGNSAPAPSNSLPNEWAMQRWTPRVDSESVPNTADGKISNNCSHGVSISNRCGVDIEQVS